MGGCCRSPGLRASGIRRLEPHGHDRKLPIGHFRSITGDGNAAFSPDGKLSAQAGFEGPAGASAASAVVIKEVATGKVVQTIPIGKASIPSGHSRARPRGRLAHSDFRASRSTREAFWCSTATSRYAVAAAGFMLGGAAAAGKSVTSRRSIRVSGKQLRDFKLEERQQ